jgi:serine/threonine protein kinase
MSDAAVAAGAVPGDGRDWLGGRYRVDGLLGRGGMGEVYYGYDERLDRQVAIKVMRSPGSPDTGVLPGSPEEAEILDAQDRDRRRFVREIRVTAGLELAGVPAVYDTGVETSSDGTSRIWVVMQLLRGSTLQDLLYQEDFPPSARDAAWPSVAWAAAIAAQIAAVLTDVHRVDIVHRDIKPSNVMIIDGGLVKVLDFGIAILRGASALPRLTQVDKTVGTPAYMSPEQSLGKLVAAASDIYSLGCVLFELLTCEQPFSASASTPLRAHHVQTPAPSVLARRPDVAAALDELVRSMMAKDPASRPSAEAVYEALLPYVASGPSPAGFSGHESSGDGSPSGDDVFGAAADRDPTRPFRRPLLGAVAGPAQAVGYSAGLEPARRPGRRDEPAGTTAAPEPLTDAEVGLLLDGVDSLLADNRASQAVRLLEDAVGRSRDAAQSLELRRTLAAALLLAGEYTRSAALFDAVGREYARFRPPSDPVVLDCSLQAGQAYAEIGNADAALRHLRFYVANAASLASRDPDEALKVAESRFLIAQMLAVTGEALEALGELRAVRPVFAAAYGPQSTMVRNLDKMISRLAS